jgi:hypothetical protein
MRRFKIVGLCLVAAFAFGAIATSAASAAKPEWLDCYKVAKGTGTYPSKEACAKSEKAGEEPREWVLSKPNLFTSTGGVSKLKAGGMTVSCESVMNKGEITGPKTGLVLVAFLGCKLSGTFACTSGGSAGSEEIKTSSLHMTLGYIKKTAPIEVGVALEGTGTEGSLAEFTCDEGKFTAKVKGSVIGVMTPINEETSNFTLTFAESGGKQAVQKLEKESKDTLEVSLNKGVFEEGVETSTDMIVTEHPTEIMA